MEGRTVKTWKVVVDGLCEACRENQVVFYEDLNTVLRVVAFSGHDDCLHQLLDAAADVNSVNAAGKTAILSAAENGIEQTVRLLINTGADVNIPTTNGETALIAAAKCGHYDCLYQLLDAGSDVNSVSASGKTTLMYVAESGIDQAVELLIESGANVNIAARNGETPLIVAAKGGHSRCVTLLLEAGADVNAVNNVGTSPLIIAVTKCTDVIVGLLIEKGACVNMVTMSGTAPLLEALHCRYYPRICRLIQAGADINARDAVGSTPLINAAVSNVKFARLFLRSGARINLVNKYNHNALTRHIFYCGDKYPKLGMLLFATGEAMDDAKRKKILLFSNNFSVPVPKYFPPEEMGLCLAHLCREIIMKHLLDLDQHENLFVRVRRLGLPQILCQYLLFYAQVDDDDDDDAIPSFSSVGWVSFFLR